MTIRQTKKPLFADCKYFNETVDGRGRGDLAIGKYAKPGHGQERPLNETPNDLSFPRFHETLFFPISPSCFTPSNFFLSLFFIPREERLTPRFEVRVGSGHIT